ncbi:MAG: helix-turn-helix domain-containing protein [Clostridia bacterium]|nr:helix-turn-helix domain-containing protein [Clostridia bacterium]
MKILNFGSCNIDLVYSLDHIVRVGETETTAKMETFPGGKGLNQSIALARAGMQVFHAGCVGSDGDMLLDLLQSSGVDVSHVARVDSKNGHAIIQVSAKGENSIFLYPGSNERVSCEMVDEVLSHFEADDFLLLQNEISNVDYIVKKAYERGMRIIFNPSPINESISSINFGMLSYLILNEVEAQEIGGGETPEENLLFLRKAYPSLHLVLTLGEEGSVYADANSEVRQAAFCVQAMDTTAAGDTFTGFFVAEIAKGSTPKEALRMASAAAALAVSRKGAAPSIPVYDEVVEALQTLKSNATGHKDETLRRQIEDYLTTNVKTATLQGLAAHLGYSAVYTGALVKRLTGSPFSKLVQSKKCSVAADLLANTERSVAEIIRDVGYENESFFRKLFEERYGKNPLEFRKKENKTHDE